MPRQTVIVLLAVPLVAFFFYSVRDHRKIPPQEKQEKTTPAETSTNLRLQLRASEDKRSGAAEPDHLAAQGHELDGETIRLLASNWVQGDVRSAFAWAEHLPQGSSRAEALDIICSQWVSQDPEAASELINRLPDTSATARLVSAVGSHWGSSDPDKGIEWVKTLPETEQTLALSSLLGAWAQRDPVAAGNYLAQLPAGQMQNEAGMSVVASWARQNPSEAAAWVLQFPPGDNREQDFRVIVSGWNNVDPAGVENWARNLPEGEARDSVLKHLVTTLAYSNPDNAAKMAGLINSPAEQRLALESLALSWSASDAVSARAWVAGLDQSDPMTAHLQSLVR